MTRRHRGGAPLAAITALIVALSAAIYFAVALDDGTRRRTGDGGRSYGSAVPASSGVWVGTWSASPVAAEPGTEVSGLAGRSVRNVVHTSVGGTSARVTLSNLFGRAPLSLTHASVALADGAGAAAESGTMRRLTFGGRTTVVVPPGAQVVSDPVVLRVPYDGDVLVTTYSPTASGPVTHHPRARQISYGAAGDRTEDLTGAAFTEQVDAWRYLTALDVLTDEADGTVVVLGDSLTDGSSSSVGENRRWTDVLARRLRQAAEDGRDAPRYGVVNQGISGNRVLADGFVGGVTSPVGESLPRGRAGGRVERFAVDNPSGLKRFERDALGRANVRVVVMDLGVNDILRDPRLADPDRILDGLRAMADQAHGHGIKIVGATLMPFKGHPGYTDAREEVRQRINAGIRDGRVFDAVADFDRALRDPYDPRRLASDYDCGDHLHPSDRGYARMAAALDLADLAGAVPARL
ncbi:SGNH/GDSL hydrolase family protein [Streptomyces sp. NPDC006458]|uniref:SGNH/GDSL hydrolase family protein n=1 Tax=Streptomyces sp. NPDC006458 TaxID=3154302 RepID=UPI0033A37F11